MTGIRHCGEAYFWPLLLIGMPFCVVIVHWHCAVATMKTGAIEFLEKPFDRETLLDLMRKAMALDAEWRAGDAQLRTL
jgi:FixJ family two-component response regulator